MEPENELHDDPTMLVRHFAAELAPGDGRTADVRIVSYGARATVRDGLGGSPRGIPYEEEFAPGVFDHQIAAANRIVGNVEHEPGISGIVARGLTLRSGGDGAYGSFAFLNTPNGDTALELVKAGVFDGISLEARPVKSRRLVDGVIQRVKANLVAVAFCRYPAYEGSGVLALREDGSPAPEFIIDENLTPPKIEPELLARMARLGIKMPDGMADEAAALLVRAFVDVAWDGSVSQYKNAAAYCAACVIDDNAPGAPKSDALCHLPIMEPGSGMMNIRAVRSAMARVDQVDTSSTNKTRAKARLTALLAQFNKQ